jgi:hypothetical protein
MSHLLTIAIAVALIAVSSTSQTAAKNKDEIVQTFLNRAEPVLESYEAHRTLVGWSDTGKRHGRLEVRTEFNRAARKLRYAILAQEGSGMVRHRALEAVLRSEAEAVQQGHMARSAMTPDNYEISLSGSDESGLYRLVIHPRRADSLLVRGAMFVGDDGALVRVEGQLAKTPSFWTTRVDVTREYRRIGGLTLLARVRSTAKTRLFGTGHFLMTYEYTHVNGHRVEAGLAEIARH